MSRREEDSITDMKEEIATLRARLATVEAALHPFASFVFGPNWGWHSLRERNGDAIVLCGYGEDGKVTGVDVSYSDFLAARAALAGDAPGICNAESSVGHHCLRAGGHPGHHLDRHGNLWSALAGDAPKEKP